VAKAREIPEVNAEEPYGAAAARILEVRSQELADHSRDVLDMDDIERVHDMRVATRRLRAALEVFEPCFPRKAHGSVLAEVKELADALGERRDRDVTIAALERFAAELSAPDRPGVQSLVERLRREQLEANEALAPFVTDKRVASLRTRLEDLAEGAREAARIDAEEKREAGADADEHAAPGAGPPATTLAAGSTGNGAGSLGNGADPETSDSR
jgi:CHAD domain-containing protein